MSCEDLHLEDIVLLQLFKDQIINNSLDQVKGEKPRLQFYYYFNEYTKLLLRDLLAT